ncbi:MAG: hypothetical protein K8S55_04240, partial [Phycisphaerae bacterium]|nr:hypothetical protein [Phycisphaerae bacterium]
EDLAWYDELGQEFSDPALSDPWDNVVDRLAYKDLPDGYTPEDYPFWQKRTPPPLPTAREMAEARRQLDVLLKPKPREGLEFAFDVYGQLVHNLVMGIGDYGRNLGYHVHDTYVMSRGLITGKPHGGLLHPDVKYRYKPATLRRFDTAYNMFKTVDPDHAFGNAAGVIICDFVGVTGISNAMDGSDVLTPNVKKSEKDRYVSGIGGGIQLIGTAVAGVKIINRLTPQKVPPVSPSVKKTAVAKRRLPQDVNVKPNAPGRKSLNRPVSKSLTQNARAQRDAARLRGAGAEDIRINQQQVNAAGKRVGINRPDLQYTNPVTKQRVYIEYESPGSMRGVVHRLRIQLNDPRGKVFIRANAK